MSTGNKFNIQKRRGFKVDINARPYTYYIIHRPTGKKYYGVRWGNWNSPEKDLGIFYFSSCLKIEKLIEEYGKESFSFEVRRVFDDKIKAIKWEERVLNRLKVWEKKDIWLNSCIGKAIYNEVSPTLGKRPSKEQIEKQKISLKNTIDNDPDYRKRMKEVKIFRDYIFTHKDGRVVNSNNLCEFARENNINKASLSAVVRGKKRSIRGWVGVIVGEEQRRHYIENHKQRHPSGPNHHYYGKKPSKESIDKNISSHQKFTYTFISPDGARFENIRSLKEFCKLNKLYSCPMYNMINGKISNYKGWTGFRREKCNQ